MSETLQQTQTDHLLERLTGVGIETAFGLFVIATTLSVLGYFLTSYFWRVHAFRKRRDRLAAAQARPPLP